MGETRLWEPFRILLFATRDEFRRMLQSVAANGHTFEECKEALKKSISFPFQSTAGDRADLIKFRY